MERSLLAAVLLGVLAVAFPGAAAAVGTQPGAMEKATREPAPHVSLSCSPTAAAAVGTQPGAMAKASREPSPHVSLSCAPASSFAGRAAADTAISISPVFFMFLPPRSRRMLPAAREAPSTGKPPPQLSGADGIARDRLAAVSGGVAPALTPARGYASRPAAARRFLGEEVCDAPQLAVEVVGACMENVPDRPCCRAIAAVVDFGCFCPVAESSVIFSNGITPPVILTLYVECRGTKNVSTLDHCLEDTPRNIYSLWTDIKYFISSTATVTATVSYAASSTYDASSIQV
uniref:Bifunctional inhibitor/plant lipid transfer protein/seed storage helical domain-containing protein n=1 Tax=Oryza nivara TaxID=4536 RepID=A0A0E0I294_ORYNI